jgi:hypothetical protein
MEREGQACAERPPSVKGIDTPEDANREVSVMDLGEVVDQALLAMETHLKGGTCGCSDETPGQQLLVAVEVEDALRCLC